MMRREREGKFDDTQESNKLIREREREQNISLVDEISNSSASRTKHTETHLHSL